MSTALLAGRLNKLVTIQTNTTTRDAYGAVIDGWGTNVTTWAAIEPLTGAELVKAQQVDPEINVKITMRYRTGMTTAKRILFGSRVYEINSIVDLLEKTESQVFLCKEIL